MLNARFQNGPKHFPFRIRPSLSVDFRVDRAFHTVHVFHVFAVSVKMKFLS